MIEVGSQAPNFELKDQFNRVHKLEDQRGKRHVLILSYPLDFTPT